MTGSGEDQRDTTSPQQTRRGVIAGDEARRNVIVVEVGPRDGLQNESALIPTGTKIAFVDALSAAGLPLIEVTSFVNPRAVPQLADAADVMTGIRRLPGVRYPVLIPNVRGSGTCTCRRRQCHRALHLRHRRLCRGQRRYDHRRHV